MPPPRITAMEDVLPSKYRSWNRIEPAAASGPFQSFGVQCSFVVQHTFIESEVLQDPEGREGDIRPSAAALGEFALDLAANLQAAFPVHDVHAEADSDNFLGTS